MSKKMIMIMAEQIALDKWAVALDKRAGIHNDNSDKHISELPSYKELEEYLTEDCGL